MTNYEPIFAARSDPKAMEALLREWWTWIRRKAYFGAKYTKRADTTIDDEDVFSEALLAFVKAAETFDPKKGPFETQASVYIKRAVIDYRRRARNLALKQTPEFFDVLSKREKDDPVQALIEREDFQGIMREMPTLRAIDVELMMLVLRGHTMDTGSRVAGVPIGSMKATLHRARKKLAITRGKT